METIGREAALMELTTIPSIGEELNGTAEGIQTARETARLASQPGQVMTEFSIVSLDRVGLGFVRESRVMAREVDQGVIGREVIGEVAFRLRAAVKDGLHSLIGTLGDHLPADDTAALTVYVRDEVDFVFLRPTKVNNSSSSLTAKGAAGAGGVAGKRLASSCAQFATLWRDTPNTRSIRRKFRPSTYNSRAFRRTASEYMCSFGAGVYLR